MLGDIVTIVRDNWLLLLDRPVPERPARRLRGDPDPVGAVDRARLPAQRPDRARTALANRALLLWPSTALVYVARGVPLLMLILWVYFMVPLLIGANVPGFVTMLVTLVIYEGAFLSEVVRGGIVALGRGQMEAARALGHSYLGAMRYVILPQALYNMIPSILSQFVSTIKETTLGYVINVPELTFAANQINNQLLTQPFQVFVILAIIYYVVCWSLTRRAILLERRIARRRAGPAGGHCRPLSPRKR